MKFMIWNMVFSLRWWMILWIVNHPQTIVEKFGIPTNPSPTFEDDKFVFETSDVQLDNIMLNTTLYKIYVDFSKVNMSDWWSFSLTIWSFPHHDDWTYCLFVTSTYFWKVYGDLETREEILKITKFIWKHIILNPLTL